MPKEPARYLRLIEAAQLLKLSKQRLSQLHAAGKLPPPDAYVGDKPAWKVQTLERWEASRGADA